MKRMKCRPFHRAAFASFESRVQTAGWCVWALWSRYALKWMVRSGGKTICEEMCIDFEHVFGVKVVHLVQNYYRIGRWHATVCALFKIFLPHHIRFAICPFADYIDEQRKFDFTRAHTHPKTFPFANLGVGRPHKYGSFRHAARSSRTVCPLHLIYTFNFRRLNAFDALQSSDRRRNSHSGGSPTANYKRILIDLFRRRRRCWWCYFVAVCVDASRSLCKIIRQRRTTCFARNEERQRPAEGAKLLTVFILYLFRHSICAFAFAANVSFHFLTLICFALKLFPLCISSVHSPFAINW